MAIWQCDFSLIPTEITNESDVKTELSFMLGKVDSWSDCILIWGNIDGNRVQLCEDGMPPELSVRIDLRSDSSQFVRDLVSFSKKMGYRVANSNGEDVPTTTKHIAIEIAKSDAFRFVTSPEKFLESLEREV